MILLKYFILMLGTTDNEHPTVEQDPLVTSENLTYMAKEL